MKKAISKARKNRGKKAKARREKMISVTEFDKAKRIAMSNFLRLGKAGRVKLYRYMERQMKMTGIELLQTDSSPRASFLMGKIHAYKEMLQEFEQWFNTPIKLYFDVAVVIQESE